MRVVSLGEAWISTTLLGKTKTVLRACVTNFETGEQDIGALVDSVGRARRQVRPVNAAR